MAIRRCSKCSKLLFLCLFHKAKGGKFGRRAECITCISLKDKARKEYFLNYNHSERGKNVQKKYHETEKFQIVRDDYEDSLKGKNKKKEIYYRNAYNITLDQIYNRLDFQNNKCAACQKDINIDSLHLDHDHTTGKIRGLLCRYCNLGLGHLGDDPDQAIIKLQNYVNFLKKSNFNDSQELIHEN